MNDLFQLIVGILASRFKSRAQLEAENLILRQQVNVLRRQSPKRPHLNNIDRLLFVWLYRWFSSILEALAIVRPETIIRGHRSGFRAYWRWRSRNRVSRPKVSFDLTQGKCCTRIESGKRDNVKDKGARIPSAESGPPLRRSWRCGQCGNCGRGPEYPRSPLAILCSWRGITERSLRN